MKEVTSGEFYFRFKVLVFDTLTHALISVESLKARVFEQEQPKGTSFSWDWTNGRLLIVSEDVEHVEQDSVCLPRALISFVSLLLQRFMI